MRGSLAVKVDLAGVLVKDHILQHRPEADGVVDLRLAGLLEADALSVAAALDVEHAVVAPAVLIVSDQGPCGVSGKGGLPSTCTEILSQNSFKPHLVVSAAKQQEMVLCSDKAGIRAWSDASFQKVRSIFSVGKEAVAGEARIRPRSEETRHSSTKYAQGPETLQLSSYHCYMGHNDRATMPKRPDHVDSHRLGTCTSRRIAGPAEYAPHCR